VLFEQHDLLLERVQLLLRKVGCRGGQRRWRWLLQRGPCRCCHSCWLQLLCSLLLPLQGQELLLLCCCQGCVCRHALGPGCLQGSLLLQLLQDILGQAAPAPGQQRLLVLLRLLLGIQQILLQHCWVVGCSCRHHHNLVAQLQRHHPQLLQRGALHDPGVCPEGGAAATS
jgi:hypothetical protein